MRKSTILLLGMLVGSLSTLAARHNPGLLGGANAASTDTYRQLGLFGDIFDRVRTDYVEPKDEAKLIEGAINGMLESLDPHSTYLNPKDFADMQVQTRGEFGGLGLEVNMEEGRLKVISPIDETPASRAGLLANDVIQKIDGAETQGLTLNQAVEKMRGKIGEAVTLQIERAGRPEPFDVRLTRETIKIRAARARVQDDVGILRVTQFTEQTFEELRAGMEKVTKEVGQERLKGWVIDLRNNPGGLLEQAILVSDAFLERGEVVSTRGRNVEDTLRFSASEGDLAGGKPVIVLVNGGSASASEIVAGALQDHKRALIMGTRSFGKGSVQTIIPLAGHQGAIKLTTARYYTPSGRSIQAKGIVPDREVLQDIPEELKGRDVTKGEAGLKGHLKNGEDEGGGSSAYIPTDPAKDKQLIAAIEHLRGAPKEVSANAASPAKP